MFAAKYQLKRVTVAIRNCASFHSLCCLVNRKGKPLNKRYFYWNNKCLALSTVTTRVPMPSIGIDTAPQSFCHSFIALSMIRCAKSSERSAVQVCQVATVVINQSNQIVHLYGAYKSQTSHRRLLQVCALKQDSF